MMRRLRRFLGDPLPWVAGLTATLLYLSYHSSFYNFDGVACAIAVELGDCRVLVHGNHLAYGWLSRWFFRLWELLGYAGPAILSLQAFSSLLGGAGVGVFAAAARRAGAGPYTAAAAAAALAASSAWWFWSLEAQVYMLGAAFLALSLAEALAERPRPVALGLFHAGAILGHVGHAMFAPAALYLLWTGTPAARRRLAARDYALSAAGAVLVAYLAAGLFCVRPPDGRAARLWLLGSAALAPDRGFVWHGSYSLSGLAQWTLTTLRIFADAAYVGGAAAWLGWALGAAGVAAGLAGATWLWRLRERRLAWAGALWLGAYAALFVTWEPHLAVYRVTDLLLFWLLAAAAAARGPRAATLAIAGWAALALPYNFLTQVRPWSDPQRNGGYQEALWLKDVTPEESWIVVWGQQQVYVPYFAHRRTVNLRYYEGDPGRLLARIEQLRAAAEPVFVTDHTLAVSGWREAFEKYGLDETGPEGERVLYRVRKPRPGRPPRRRRRVR